MNVRPLIAATALWLGCSFAHAQGEWRCDCTTIVDSCAATVEVFDQWVEISTDSLRCARVDYFIDGLPFVSVVVDGESREDWISRSGQSEVLIQSCQVCRDNSRDQASRSTRSSAAPSTAASERLTALIQAEPQYPQSALSRGLEGAVTVEFTVTPGGDVANPRVISSQPEGVFDSASLSAVSRWRYPADSNREPTTISETLSFSLTDFIWSTPGAADRPADLRAGSVNRCVRESESYDFGEMIEVRLASACAQPLIAYACSVGTGAYADRWVCTDSDSQEFVLVRSTGSRVGGTVPVEGRFGQRPYEYRDAFFVARTPNTEYWWLACASSDLRCREAGRQWTRSLNGQTARIDPQSRSRVPVQRSF